MREWVLLLAAQLSTASAAFASTAPAAPWERWHDLRSMAVLGWPGQSLLHSSYCHDGCRYDRTSVEPGAGGRRFLRLETTPDGVEAVAFEDIGPGAITRIWMTMGHGVSEPLDPSIRVRIYVDEAADPVIDVPLPQLFDGSTPPFVPPLAYDRMTSSGGQVSYVPITYRTGIRVALLNGADARLWFQFNHTRLPLQHALAVEPFRPDARNDSLAALLESAGSSLWSGRYRYSTTLGIAQPPADARVMQLTNGSPRQVLVDRVGPGWLDAIVVNVSPTHWPALRVRVEVDGETTIDVPMTEFFAVDPLASVQTRSLFAGIDEGGSLYARWPMPFRKRIRVSVLRVDAAAGEIALRYAADVRRTRVDAQAAPFRIDARSACPTRLPDFRLFSYEGSGRMVGLIAYKTTDGVRGGAYFLEGDERLYVDDALQPQWYGTGTEDLFNGGFYYDRGAFTLPLHGAPTQAGGGVDFASTAYRWFLTDAPEWRRSIDLRLESGATGTQPFCTRSVAYYYAHATPADIVADVLDLSDDASIVDAGYVAPAGAECAIAMGAFGSEPPAEIAQRVCRVQAGESRFTLTSAAPVSSIRLRRTIDASLDDVQGQAADVWVNGAPGGSFPPVLRNVHRRWTQQGVEVALDAAAQQFAFELRPRGAMTEVRYELAVPRASPRDGANAPSQRQRPRRD